MEPIIPTMEPSVQTSEFRRNFGRYQALAQSAAVAVASHGKIIGYFIGREEYQAFRRYRESSSLTAEPAAVKGDAEPKP